MTWLNLKVNEIADIYLHWLWHGAWQGAVVAIVVWAVLKLFPRIPLSVQYWLLVLALVKFMIPPMMASPSGLFSILLVPSSEVDVRTLNVPASNLVSGRRPSLANSSGSETAVPPLMPLPPDVTGDNSQDAMPIPVPVGIKAVIEQSQGYSPTGVPIAGAPRITWQKIMLLELHVLGSLMFLAWIAVQMIRLRRIVVGSRGIKLSDFGKSIPFSVDALRKFDGIRLRCSDRVNGPMAFGILSPTILTPTAVLSGESQLLESVLLHEVAHIRHKDLWMRWLEVAIQTMWWFHPLVWLLCRKISAVSEDICDDFVIANGSAKEDQYCQTLITIAAQSPRPVGSLLACGIMDAHPLARRIKRLMNQERLRARPLSIVASTLILVAALVLLPGVRTQRLVQAQAPEAKPDSAEREQAPPQIQLTTQPPMEVSQNGLRLKLRLGRLELHRANVHGVVQNEAGEPVSGATVIIGSARSNVLEGTDDQGRNYSFKGEIARATTGKDGRYEFKDLVVPCREPDKDFPYPEPLNAKLQIVAIAQDYGLTWSHVFRYRPDIEVGSEASKAKPNVAANEDFGHVFFHGQDIEVPVTIVKGVTLHGTVLDANGSPIPDVVVRLGRVLMPEDGIDSEPRMTVYSFLGSPLKELGHAPCGIIPLEFRETKTDGQGHYQLEHVPMKARAGVSFSHIRFPANQFYEISTANDPSAKRDIATGEPLDVIVKTVTELQLSVTDGMGPKLPGSRFEIVASFTDSSTQHSTIATADASGIAKMRLTEGHYSMRISPPSGKKLWSSIFPIDVKDDSKPHEISFAANSPQPIRIKATSQQDGRGIKDIAFEFSREGMNPVWLPVTTQGIASEYVRTDYAGILDAMFSPSVMRIRVAGEEMRAMLRDKEPVLISSPHTSEIEFVFANRPKSGPDFDARYEKLSRGRYRYRTHNHLQKNDATLSQIEELIASMRTTSPDEALKQIQNFFGTYTLGQSTIIQDGRRRIVMDAEASGSGIAVEDGMHNMQFKPDNRQCDVYFSRDSRVFTQSIHRLLVMPFLFNNKEKDSDPSRVPPIQNEQKFVREILNNGSHLTETFTPDRQFLLEKRVTEKGEGNKRQHIEMGWQLFPHKIDTLTVPKMVIKARFNDEILDRLEIVVFDEMELLDKVPGDTFAMSVPAGTMIIDYRFNPDHASSPDIHTLRFATFDVAALLKPLSTWSMLDSKPKP